MGSRANYVLKDGDSWTLHYSHWGAQRIDADFFWGPEHAERFIRAQERCEPTAWLDDRWAEGGALMDLREQRLLLFGGENIRFGVPERRAMLTLVRTNWPGWTIEWAHEELGDFVDALGLPRTLVQSDLPWSSPGSPKPAAKDEDNSTIVSIRRLDGTLVLYPTVCSVEPLVLAGPDLMRLAGAHRARRSFRFAEFPMGGVHVDERERALGYWTVDEQQDLRAEAVRAWSGWQVQSWGDGFEVHLELLGNAVEVPVPDMRALLRRCAAEIRSAMQDDVVEQVRDVVALLRSEGRDVEITAPIDQHVPVPPEPRSEGRDAVIQRALASAAERLGLRL